MQLVPVIDLQHHQVVHATGGQRALYRPLRSAQFPHTRMPDVARLLCEHCATTTLYLADLDALQGRAPQIDAVAALLDAQPTITLWLDAGFGQAADIDAWMRRLGPAAARVQPVLASESLGSVAALREALAAWPRALLSLDSRAGAPLDRGGVWQAAEAWPGRLIAMDLARVGASAGPGIEHLAALRARAPHAFWIGSGGLRDDTDVAVAERSGARAWLVASALHAGRIAPRPATTPGATDCGDGGDAGHTVSRAARLGLLAAARACSSVLAGVAAAPMLRGMRFARH